MRRHGGGGGATAVLVRCHGSHGGAAAVMAVPRRSHWDWPNSRWPCGNFEHVQSFRRATAKVRGVDSFPRCYGRSIKEPQRNHGDHDGATAFYAVQTPQWHRASGVTGLECPRFWQLSAVLRGSMTEPLRNHGDHGDATAVTAVQAPQWHRSGTAPPVWRG